VRSVGDLVSRIGLRVPVVQAGMGGGIAGHRLAAAVSEAGGLGTLGTLAPQALHRELRAARELTGRALAVNLLLPFARDEHWAVAREADVVVTFWGRPVRRAPGIWIHQCGSVEEMLAARDAGADAVIAQGVEAGGHVRGATPALELLEQARRTLGGYPVLLAGGIATGTDARSALEAGAVAVVAGTRFLLSHESSAHPEYKRRLLDADHTFITELFGLGWPAPHRVIANRATERWLRGGREPAAVRLANRLAVPLATRLPLAATARLATRQQVGLPLFGPHPPLVGSPERLLDTGPLYAGETVARIHELRPAAELVAELSG
jgi:NAD(P)H-dependent flavin oxidoreductase YrpB (nitropropane dioxygenase family)